MHPSTLKRWGALRGSEDPLLTKLLWACEKSLSGSTQISNSWIEDGGPTNHHQLELAQTLLADTIAWRKRQRKLIEAIDYTKRKTAEKFIKQLHDWDTASTMAQQMLINDRKAWLSEFENAPKTPCPEAYVPQRDPMGRMFAQDEQEMLRLQVGEDSAP